MAGVHNWFQSANDRGEWCDIVSAAAGVKEPAPKTIVCHVCGRLFRRRADMARHKCTAVRQLPVPHRPGSVQCPACGRWLRSRGGLAVHKCQESDNCDARPPSDAPPVAEGPGVYSLPAYFQVYCWPQAPSLWTPPVAPYSD